MPIWIPQPTYLIQLSSSHSGLCKSTSLKYIDRGQELRACELLCASFPMDASRCADNLWRKQIILPCPRCSQGCSLRELEHYSSGAINLYWARFWLSKIWGWCQFQGTSRMQSVSSSSQDQGLHRITWFFCLSREKLFLLAAAPRPRIALPCHGSVLNPSRQDTCLGWEIWRMSTTLV